MCTLIIILIINDVFTVDMKLWQNSGEINLLLILMKNNKMFFDVEILF